MISLRLPVLALLGFMISSVPAFSWVLDGTKTITLITREGQSIPFGTVTFSPDGDRTHFEVSIDKPKLKDYFLSMKEFKCLDGTGEIVCHVPYPYANPGWIKPGDYAWLEHSLMFLYKSPSEFGAKLWNGLYYRLSLTDDGLVGHPKTIDLNQIAAPPDDLSHPPFGPDEQGEVTPSTHWITAIEIR